MENKPKQTAVEWLSEQLWKTPQYETEWQKIIEQAKAMHKEEILIAYDNGWEAGSYNPEQYYNETYGKNTTDNTNL